MTHMRMAGSVEAVLMDVINNLTDAEIFQATGKKRGHFYKVANPLNSMGLHMDDAAGLDAALLAKGMPARFTQLFAEMVAARTASGTPREIDLDRKMRRLTIEAGELCKALDEAMIEGALTIPGRRKIAREAQDVIDVGVMIRDACEPPHEAGGNIASIRKGAA